MDFQEHFRQHYQSIYRFAHRMLGSRESAEDVAQEAFLRLAKKAPEGMAEEAGRRWLFVVARNLCLNRLRRRSVRREIALENCPEPTAREPGPRDRALAKERGRWARRAIAELPEPMREVVILREYEDLSYAEIAEITGCSLGTVKSRLARAREELRQKLEPIQRETP